MFKKSKVVMLPTNERSNIVKNPGLSKQLHFSSEKCMVFPGINSTFQHLYILSDEEIKDGDWFYSPKVNKILRNLFNKFEQGDKKIIATTDSSLGLPTPSNSFIKKYCELGGIDEILVEYKEEELDDWEPVKLKIAPDNTITIKKVKDSWSMVELEAKFHKFTQELREEFSDISYEIQMFSNKWIEENL